MNRTAMSNRTIGPKFTWAVTTALAAGLLTGCATQSAPRADLSASKAEAALAKGKHEKAIAHAEAAVLAEPRNAAYRAMLGSAYLDAGRFASAATTFDDAMKLGDNSARSALSLALALSGAGDYQQASAVLSDWEGDIAAADLGLAYALAGQPERGIHVMSNAIRGGDNTPKMRQNLAYAFALAGRWKEARLMAAQDVPADKLGERIEEWALMAQPQAWQARVAALLGAPVGVADGGQPVQLALSNHPSIEQLAAEAAAYAQPVEVAEAAPTSHHGGEPLPAGDAAPEVAVRSYAAPQYHASLAPAPRWRK
jgi:Flp pilus assembly protein TadD